MSKLPQCFARLFMLVSFLLFLVGPFVPAPVAPSTQHSNTFANLPQVAQSLVSATLGRDNSTYQFQPTTEGYLTANAANSLRADFSNAGMHLQSGDSHWTFTLRGIGYGRALQSVSTVEPIVSANRLEYAHDTFTEWFVNGPAGLEQGWTLNSRPQGTGNELTLALALAGNAHVNADGSSIALLRADGTSALNYTGLSAYDAAGHALRAWFELGKDEVASSLRIRIDDTNAQYPVTIDPYVLQAGLTNASGTGNDQLGYSVAVSADGSTIVAGAINVGSGKGAAYVFVKSGTSWVWTPAPDATLTKAGGATTDSLGKSVAISANGSTIVVGIPGAYVGAAPNVGAAYVYVRPGGGWSGSIVTPTATITNSGNVSLSAEELGYSVAMNPNASIIAVGATHAISGTGAVYVFNKPGGGWTGNINVPSARLSNAAGTPGDFVGTALAISADGSTIVAGTPGVSGSITLVGAAYVYVKPGGGWANSNTPNATLTKSGDGTFTYMGNSVAVSSDGSTIVAGAPGANQARVYARPGGGWVGSIITPTAVLTKSGSVTQDLVGNAVAISADGLTIAAGAPYAPYSGTPGSGRAYVYVKPGGVWTSTGNPNITLASAYGVDGDNLGFALAVNSNATTIVAGAKGVNGNTGAAHVFFQPSNNANLSNLVLSNGTLSPSFAPNTSNYSASVGNSLSSITVTPTLSDPYAHIYVRVNYGGLSAVTSGNPSSPLALNVGPNPIEVSVIAEDGTTLNIYTVIVTRMALAFLPFIWK